METQLIRAQNKLITNGNGVILFGLWAVIKAVLMIVFRFRSMFEAVSAETEEIISFSLFSLIAGIFIFVIVLIILLFHLFIGLCARSDALGKRNRYVYIVIAAFYAGVTGISTFFTARNIFTTEEMLISTVVSLLVDITMLLILVELVVSAIRVKRLRKFLGKERAVSACS